MSKIELSKRRDIIQLATGIISLAVASISFLTTIFESKYNIALLLIGATLIIQKLCKKVLISKREVFGVITQSYPTKTRKIAKVIKSTSWFLLIFPAFVLISTMVPQGKKCNAAEPHFGILIANFSYSPDDDFSYKLHSLLESQLLNVDTIKTLKVNHFLSLQKTSYVDSVTALFSESCLNHGLLVFGKRSIESKLFDCNIYINRIAKLTTEPIGKKKGNVLFLQNPNIVNFSIEEQSKTVADFILALLYYNSEDQMAATKKFKQAMQLSSTNDNTRFKSYCHLFLGNSLVRQSKFTEAITSYKSGLIFDSLSSFLHYNLGTAFLNIADSMHAFYEYETAKRLNPKMANPISNYVNIRAADLFPTKDKTAKKSFPRLTDHQASIIKNEEATSGANAENKEYQVLKSGEKYGIRNSNGIVIVPCQYDYIDQNVFVYKDLKFFIVKKGSKYGAICPKGYLDVPIIHPSIDYVRAILKTTIDLAPEMLAH